MPDYDVKLGIWVRIQDVENPEKAEERAIQTIKDDPHFFFPDVEVELIEKI